MAHTLKSVRDILAGYAGESDAYAEYLTGKSDLLKHFKAGVNAAWREGYDLERDELRYADESGDAPGDAFSDGFVYSASYL